MSGGDAGCAPGDAAALGVSGPVGLGRSRAWRRRRRPRGRRGRARPSRRRWPRCGPARWARAVGLVGGSATDQSLSSSCRSRSSSRALGRWARRAPVPAPVCGGRAGVGEPVGRELLPPAARAGWPLRLGGRGAEGRALARAIGPDERGLGVLERRELGEARRCRRRDLASRPATARTRRGSCRTLRAGGLGDVEGLVRGSARRRARPPSSGGPRTAGAANRAEAPRARSEANGGRPAAVRARLSGGIGVPVWRSQRGLLLDRRISRVPDCRVPLCRVPAHGSLGLGPDCSVSVATTQAISRGQRPDHRRRLNRRTASPPTRTSWSAWRPPAARSGSPPGGRIRTSTRSSSPGRSGPRGALRHRNRVGR